MKAAILTAVAALGGLVGCSGSPSAAPTVQSPSASTEGVIQTNPLRIVHSPRVVTDDMHLQPGQCHARQASQGQPLPDPVCTPGAIDPAVTPDTIRSTICVSGWTATVRPPSSATARWKLTSEADYGDPPGFTGEYDHLVPLELGGANSTSNLWPEEGQIPNRKDHVEGRLRAAVCAGRISLHQAQAEIAADWTTATW
jgi:hypothetical protein